MAIQSELLETDDCNDGGGVDNAGGDLKKGPWTQAEDAILAEYVHKHGEGNWNAVQKTTGLLRCGKSCRFRWTNHLRPDLKKGPFTDEEERLIVELHAKIGNRWARMTAHLPGRTDNEIKNYWNTRLKKHQRCGLPIYPPNICSAEVEESQQGNDSGGTDSDSKGCFDSLHMENHDLPVIKFKNFVPKFTDIAQGFMQMEELGLPSSSSFMLPTMHQQEHLGQFTTFPGNSCSGMHWVPSFGQFPEYSYGNIAQHQNFGSSPGRDPGSLISPYSSAMAGSQTFSIFNSSASERTSVGMKTELPSFQNPETDIHGWARSSLQPPEFNSMGTFFQSPPGTYTIEPECVAPCCSGLLDAVVYECKALNTRKTCL